MNQQGSYDPEVRPCDSSQNGRGGLFFIVNDAQLHADVSDLLIGGTAAFGLENASSPSAVPSHPECCYYGDAVCSAGQVCCTGGDSSYSSESSCTHYGAAHGCVWTAT